ncbi:MAG: hypothetical protein U5N86_11270 [Planctomycetota bacterium]|nr:hypothetical protein [Planctomycetota bacterium]
MRGRLFLCALMVLVALAYSGCAKYSSNDTSVAKYSRLGASCTVLPSMQCSVDDSFAWSPRRDFVAGPYLFTWFRKRYEPTKLSTAASDALFSAKGYYVSLVDPEKAEIVHYDLRGVPEEGCRASLSKITDDAAQLKPEFISAHVKVCHVSREQVFFEMNKDFYRLNVKDGKIQKLRGPSVFLGADPDKDNWHYSPHTRQ